MKIILKKNKLIHTTYSPDFYNDNSSQRVWNWRNHGHRYQ